jgi:hypothetical protein
MPFVMGQRRPNYSAHASEPCFGQGKGKESLMEQSEQTIDELSFLQVNTVRVGGHLRIFANY